MNKKIFSDKYIPIGKITKPHGLTGFLKFILFNEESNILLDQEFLNINKNSKSIKLKIENIDVSSLLIKFFDINNRESAEQYRECEIVILRSKIKGNKDDLYFVDLIGCDLYFDSDKVGMISNVVSYAGNDLLKMVDNEKKEHLIPIKKELIKFFDIEDRKLVMKTIEGILDI